MTKALKAVTTTAQDLTALARQFRTVAAAYRAATNDAEHRAASADMRPIAEAAAKIKARDSAELAVKASMATGTAYSIADMTLVRSILADAKRLGRKQADN
jgi:hypothetical protein